MQCCYANPELYVDPDAFYEIRPECRDDVPITRFKPLPGRTLSARRWQASFSPDGHLDIISVLKRIQRGGVHSTIKGEVWEFLLGCYDPNSTFDQRNELRQSRRSEYEGLKNKCKEMEKSVGSGVVITMPLITDDGQPAEASRNIHNKTEPPVGTETESPVEKTESSVDKGETEDPVEGETESPVDKGETEDPVGKETESPVGKETESPVGKETEDPVGKETESSVGKETESPVGKETEDPVGKETEDPVEDEKEAAVDRDVVQWKLSLHQIGLDVVRTDRSLVYYEDPVHRARLWDLLAVYSWIDKDINYCQGMSDLCSPISILIENEADAFWCFERLMRRLRGNFKSTSTSIGVRSQLTTLSNIIKSVDPKLHQHIEELDGGEYLFAFRMLMVLFRREFSFVDSLYLWELMWGMEYNPNTFSLYQSSADISALPATSSSSTSSLHHSNSLKKYGRFEKRNLQKNPNPQIPPFPVFIVAGVLEAKSKRLKKEAKGLDDVVKILNDITGSLDAKKACKEALKVHKKYLNMVKVS